MAQQIQVLHSLFLIIPGGNNNNKLSPLRESLYDLVSKSAPDYIIEENRKKEFERLGGMIYKVQKGSETFVKTSAGVTWIFHERYGEVGLPRTDEFGALLWNEAASFFPVRSAEKNYDYLDQTFPRPGLPIPGLKDFISAHTEQTQVVKEALTIWENIRDHLYRNRCMICDATLTKYEVWLVGPHDFLRTCETHRRYAGVYQPDVIRQGLGIPPREYLNKEIIQAL